MTKRVLVTGAQGQLGSEIRALTAHYPAFIWIATDVDQLDLTDARAVSGFIDNHSIDYVINCAAYTAVDRAEEDADACYRINCEAVKNVALAAAGQRAKVLHVSTDYVFDGRSTRPYRETDLPHPQSVYGKSKRAGEEALLAACPESIIIRTAWLYSAFGSNFVRTMLRLGRERTDLDVVCDQWGTPTYAADLAQALLTIVLRAEQTGDFPAGVYHYSNEGITTWFDFTRKIFEQMGITACTVHPVTTAQYPTLAPRPAYSVLDKTKWKATFGATVPAWEEALVRCLRKIESERRPEL
jgi:dTDP-4-dehydrorhamnose reductase